MLIFESVSLSAQNEQIKWLTVEQAQREDSLKGNRPWIIDVYTDWCGWCKRMNQTTFANKDIAVYINNNFRPVKLNAETTDTVSYQGKKYGFDGRVNEFAKMILGGRMSYPTIVYKDTSGNMLPVPGYSDIKGIEPLLVYFACNLSSTVDPEKFNKYYMCAFPTIYSQELKQMSDETFDAKGNKTKSSEMPDTTGVVNWIDFKVIESKMKIEPRPIILDLRVSWDIPGMITRNAVFKDAKLAEYINKNFYAAKFDVLSQDSLLIMGDVFKGNGAGNPHQLAVALTNGSFKFPSLLIFDKDFKLLNNSHDFFDAAFWEIVLKFYKQEAYKKENFQSFYQNGHYNN